jgi:hypothetical protein
LRLGAAPAPSSSCLGKRPPSLALVAPLVRTMALHHGLCRLHLPLARRSQTMVHALQQETHFHHLAASHLHHHDHDLQRCRCRSAYLGLRRCGWPRLVDPSVDSDSQDAHLRHQTETCRLAWTGSAAGQPFSPEPHQRTFPRQCRRASLPSPSCFLLQVATESEGRGAWRFRHCPRLRWRGRLLQRQLPRAEVKLSMQTASAALPWRRR